MQKNKNYNFMISAKKKGCSSNIYNSHMYANNVNAALGSTSICQFPVSNKMDGWRMEIMFKIHPITLVLSLFRYSTGIYISTHTLFSFQNFHFSRINALFLLFFFCWKLKININLNQLRVSIYIAKTNISKT